MNTLKNILAGFLVSFVGSLPLGYLNVVGFRINETSGSGSLVFYLFGVIAVEAVVVYLTLVFANYLSKNRKLIKGIEIFSVFFLLVLAFLFWIQSGGNSASGQYLERHSEYSSFWTGVILSAVNFLQFPFWLGWNIYLVNAGYVTVPKYQKFSYIAAVLAGTFAGMFAFVRVLNFITASSEGIAGHLMPHIIPGIFICFAIWQAWQVYRKHYRKTSGG